MTCEEKDALLSLLALHGFVVTHQDAGSVVIRGLHKFGGLPRYTKLVLRVKHRRKGDVWHITDITASAHQRYRIYDANQIIDKLFPREADHNANT
jgi:hypothetical protein